MDGTPLPETESARFLDRDFSQCFYQLRHYDGQIFEICKFVLTASVSILGGALALYKYGLETGIDYRLPAASALFLGSIFGILFLALMTRNRAYFVLTARYINENRHFFLRNRPLGFPNATGMYVNRSKPAYFSWLSSQSLALYVLSISNSGLFAAAAFIVRYGIYAVFLSAALCAVQITVAVVCLRRLERHAAGFQVEENSSQFDTDDAGR
jgi:hypothetical protein